MIFLKKILTEIYVPAIGRTFDIFIPSEQPMYIILDLIKKAVYEISGGLFVPDKNTAICYRDDGTILNIDKTVYELRIRNGSKLMLI